MFKAVYGTIDFLALLSKWLLVRHRSKMLGMTFYELYFDGMCPIWHFMSVKSPFDSALWDFLEKNLIFLVEKARKMSRFLKNNMIFLKKIPKYVENSREFLWEFLENREAKKLENSRDFSSENSLSRNPTCYNPKV